MLFTVFSFLNMQEKNSLYWGTWMKSVLVVEDNRKAAVLVEKILKEIDGSIRVSFATDCEKAKQMLLQEDFHLFVVDILLNNSNPNDATGLDFVQFLRGFKKYEYTPVVITTSVAEMKDHAYDNLDCYKYLEKPYDRERAKAVLKKALEMPLEYDKNQYFHIRTDGIVRAVKCKEIVYIQYDRRKVCFCLTNGFLEIYYKSLTEIYKELPEGMFLRCGKDAIVNRGYIEYADFKVGMLYLVKPYPEIAIGRTYKKKVLEELTND